MVAGHLRLPRRAGGRASAQRCARCARSGWPARCTARRCSTPTAGCCAPASSGTTAAARRSAPSSRPRRRALRAITGNVAMPGFTAPKLLWVRAARAGRVRAHRAACCCPRPGCAGACAARRSRTCPTRRARCGSTSRAGAGPTTLLAACGLDESQMPRLVEGTMPAGELRAPVGRALGLRAARRSIAGGAGDNAAGAVALGAVQPGDAFLSLGTSGVLWVTTARIAPGARARRARLLPCGAADLAPDGRAAERRGLACLVGRVHRAATKPRCSAELPAPAERAGAVLVPALPERRAHAAQRRRACAAPSCSLAAEHDPRRR